MNDEMKRLIEDAARLLGLTVKKSKFLDFVFLQDGQWVLFNPLDPERGDLMKVAMAAELVISHYDGWVRWVSGGKHGQEHFLRNNHNSLAIAVLRAASAVLKAREA